MGLRDIKSDFGSSVRKWRKQLGLSQQALAHRAGLHRTYICDVERGTRNVSLDCIQRFAHALQISIAELFPDDLRDTAGNIAPTHLDHLLLVGKESNGLAAALKDLRATCPGIRVDATPDVEEVAKLFFSQTSDPSDDLNRPKLILIDCDLPGAHRLIDQARVQPQSIPLVVLVRSAAARDSLMREKAGVAASMVKPLTLQALREIAVRFRLCLA